MGAIVEGSYDGSNDSVTDIMDRLERYADLIEPWSEAVSKRLIDTLVISDDAMWRDRSERISAGLRDLMDSGTGAVTRSIIDEQVKLFKSLPLQAADRVYDIHNQAIEAVVSGKRSSTLTDEIMRTGDVTEARARTIARTEVGRASTAITQARSTSIGSRGYIWRTADDSDVRHSHKQMEGKYVDWSNPPTLDGMTGHAGQFPNCRCYCEVVVPED
ncbi:phage head morphogenesis protein [Pantoea sp. Seng]|uniref:phage head morphogenesis protein n=1 Tax=Pantoea sp. Seng TaxID=2576761 RepID=UPI001323E9EF|nr:phage minor head protein [Pantoea sp. Seng]MXP53415.1 phage head morphogenesis protein [Pantoea sp. Seng]